MDRTAVASGCTSSERTQTSTLIYIITYNCSLLLLLQRIVLARESCAAGEVAFRAFPRCRSDAMRAKCYKRRTVQAWVLAMKKSEEVMGIDRVILVEYGHF